MVDCHLLSNKKVVQKLSNCERMAPGHAHAIFEFDATSMFPAAMATDVLPVKLDRSYDVIYMGDFDCMDRLGEVHVR